MQLPTQTLTVFNESCIAFDCRLLIKSDYTWLVSPMTLYCFVMENYIGQDLFFDCTHGEDIQVSCLIGVLQKLAKDLIIPKTKIIVKSHTYDVDVDGITVIRSDSIDYAFLAKKYFSVVQNDSFDRTFLALFCRYTPYRVLTAKHLFDNFVDNTFLSLRNVDNAISEMKILGGENLFHEFSNITDWLKSIGSSLRIDSIGDETSVPWDESMDSIKSFQSRYFIEIAVERNTWNGNYFPTEKIFRSFALGKPFLVYGGRGTLAFLRNHGFQTFGQIIDESYDQIENDHDRFRAFLKEITRLGQLSMPELKMAGMMMKDTFIHNQLMLNHK